MDEKKLKKLRISSDKMDQLQGFEHVVDLLIDENEKKEKEKTEKIRAKHGDSYELYNFLELENNRLNKLDQLFSYKAHNIIHYSQIAKLKKIQQNNLIKEKRKLLEKLLTQKSPYLANLEYFFNQSFKKLRGSTTGQDQE